MKKTAELLTIILKIAGITSCISHITPSTDFTCQIPESSIEKY